MCLLNFKTTTFNINSTDHRFYIKIWRDNLYHCTVKPWFTSALLCESLDLWGKINKRQWKCLDLQTVSWYMSRLFVQVKDVSVGYFCLVHCKVSALKAKHYGKAVSVCILYLQRQHPSTCVSSCLNSSMWSLFSTQQWVQQWVVILVCDGNYRRNQSHEPRCDYWYQVIIYHQVAVLAMSMGTWVEFMVILSAPGPDTADGGLCTRLRANGIMRDKAHVYKVRFKVKS